MHILLIQLCELALSIEGLKHARVSLMMERRRRRGLADRLPFNTEAFDKPSYKSIRTTPTTRRFGLLCSERCLLLDTEEDHKEGGNQGRYTLMTTNRRVESQGIAYLSGDRD